MDFGNATLVVDPIYLVEFAHAGPISFQVTFLRERPPAGRPEYLFGPIV